jgi:hypothetical protein
VWEKRNHAGVVVLNVRTRDKQQKKFACPKHTQKANKEIRQRSATQN